MPSTGRAPKLVKIVGLASAFAIATTTTGSWSQTLSEGTRTCVDAYGSAQEFRKNNDLLKARQALWTCAGASCPVIIQGDCTTWLGQVVDAIPSVVLEAKFDDDNVFDVSVSMDGVPIATQLDGKPIEINPGLHSFVFERPGDAPVEKKVIIPAHAKSQVILASWRSPTPAPVRSSTALAMPKPSAEMVRPIPPLSYVLGGTAVAALGTFAVLGLTGNGSKQNLESSCSPHCSSSSVTSVETRFVAADIAAGVGAIAAIGAVTVFLARPERPAHVPALTSVGVAPTCGGAALEWRGSF